MVGIMSLMPALMNLSMAEIVSTLGLPENVRLALCDNQGQLGDLLALAQASEDGDLNSLAEHQERLPALSLKALNRAQTSALQWANAIARA